MTNSYPTRRSAGLLDSGPVDVKGRRVDREAAVGRFRLDPCFIADQRIRTIGLRGARRDARRQQVRAAGAEALGDPRIDGDGRSEARRVGKESVSTCRSRWSPYN